MASARTRNMIEHDEHAKHIGGAAEQEDRAVDRGDGAVPGVFRNARQKRADRGDQRQRRSLESVGFFQAKTIRMTHADARPPKRARSSLTTVADPAHQGRDGEADRRLAENRGALHDEPETQEGRKQLAARALRPRKSATTRWRSIIITRSRRPLPDRHRAGLRDRDHRHDGAELCLRSGSASSASASWGSRCSRRMPCICSSTAMRRTVSRRRGPDRRQPAGCGQRQPRLRDQGQIRAACAV